MKFFAIIKKTWLLLLLIAFSFSACNKLELAAVPNVQPEQATSPTLASLLDDPSFSLFKAAVTKAGLIPTLSVPTLRFTVFVPDDAAITASLSPILPPGVTPAMYIASLTAASASGLVQYHIVPQVISASSIPGSFPNFQYPTILNPAPTVSPFLRLMTFPSARGNFAWVNNVPITAINIQAVNGIMHKVARIVLPPSIDLWSKIQTDPDLSYFRAAISRADNGAPVGGRLEDAMSMAANPASIASNLTVFAPNDAAMKTFLTGALYQAFIAQNFPPANAIAAATALVTNFGSLLLSNPASIPDIPGFPPGIGAQIAAVITPTLAKGIVAYHILSGQSGSFAPPGIRVFSVNIPTSVTNVKTFLNSGIALHPGLTIQATFVTGVPVVAAATVKGYGNASASNIIIGPTSSDLHFINGVLHKIDQVLLPQ